MKKVGVTYEITKSIYMEYYVHDDQYTDIYEGSLPGEIISDLEWRLEDNDYGCRSDDWTAIDLETGKMLQDWR